MVFVNALSLVTIGLCCISKVPQIKTVIDNRSSKGLNILAVSIELFRFVVIWLYNYCNGYSVLSYLEYPMLLLQQIVLLYFILEYQNLITTKVMAFSLLGAITILLFMNGILPRELLTYLLPLGTPIVLFSRMIQWNDLYRTKQADNINLTTCFLMCFTSFARGITVLAGSADKILLINLAASLFSGLAVYVTAFYYKSKSKKNI